ncbi:hypothetical protein NLJ89_g886 [Agrocybe chaxingu]|uniref:Uncharacterized protein n=1 Tax=Agrocybe chaxingu TaxID=84603 RepID=A0A9W8TG00_9AGAR|nr:hypothetical protein NLJ89_g886 [Agrocybe chaxingu]
MTAPVLAGAPTPTADHNIGQFQPQVPIRHISRNGSHARESQQPQANGTFSDEVMDMWSDAPTGFGPDDWDMYLGGFPSVDESHWHTMTSHF